MTKYICDRCGADVPKHSMLSRLGHMFQHFPQVAYVPCADDEFLQWGEYCERCVRLIKRFAQVEALSPREPVTVSAPPLWEVARPSLEAKDGR